MIANWHTLLLFVQEVYYFNSTLKQNPLPVESRRRLVTITLGLNLDNQSMMYQPDMVLILTIVMYLISGASATCNL
ncbi:hypothetical protein H6F86_05565 [Phormidium sp. FACHB-592]|uniref:hypothetical protein n=1 Tax=Stenomitos frigidus TaxID=1886765 RepID=UPI0019876CC9|nr:hypothetical protein [Phormidium sp. FACHB-592]